MRITAFKVLVMMAFAAISQNLTADQFDLRINKVYPAQDMVEVINTGAAFTTTQNHPFCHGRTYSSIIPSGTSFEAGEAKMFAITGLRDAGPDIWLYNNGAFGDGNDIIHGVGYGTGSPNRITEAINGGVWTGGPTAAPGANEFIEWDGNQFFPQTAANFAITPISTNIRVVHLSQNTPPVDVFANGAGPVVEDLEFPDGTPYLAIPPGEYTFDVGAANTPITSAVLQITSITLEQDMFYSAVAYDELTSITALPLVDDLSPTTGIRVRGIHTATGVGEVDILALGDGGLNGAILFEDVGFGEPSENAELPAGAYRVGLDLDNNLKADLAFQLPALPADTKANLFAVNDGHNIFLFAHLDDGTTAVINVENTSSTIRVVHLSPDAPGVDIYVDGAGPVLENLTFPDGSPFLTVPPGTYTFDVVPNGAPITSSVLTIANQTLDPGEHYSAIAYDELASITGLALLEDFTITDQLRVRAIHTATGVGQVDVLALGADSFVGTELFSNLDFGNESIYAELPPAAYRVGLDTNNDLTAEFAFEIPALPGGTIANLYAVNDSGAISLFAHLDDGTTVSIPAEAPDNTAIRVVHLSPDAPGVDIYANGAGPVVPNLTFPDGTAFLSIAPGTYTFDVVPNGAPITSSVLTIADQQLLAGEFYSAAAYDTLDNITGLALLEDFTITNSLRVRAIHTATGVGQVDVLALGAGSFTGTALFQNLDFGNPSEYAELPAGQYRVGLDTNDDLNAEFAFELPSLTSGTIANLYAVNDDGNIFLFAHLDDGTTATIPAIAAPPETNVRVLHLSPDAGPVDVFAQVVPGPVGPPISPVIEDLTFPTNQGFLPIPPATYQFDVAPANQPIGSSVLTLGPITLEENQFYTAVAYDTLSNISGLALVEDFTPTTGIRVRAIHTASGVGEVDVLALGESGTAGAVLFPDVAFGAIADYTVLPAGAYRVGLDLDNDLNAELTFQLPALPAGVIANIFAVNDGGSVFLLAQLQDGTTVVINPEAEEGTLWYFAEGDTENDFQTFLLVVNHNVSDTANVSLTVYFEDTSRAPETFDAVIPNNFRFTYRLQEILSSPGKFSMKLESDIPVFAERAVYWNPGGNFRWGGTDAIGSTQLSTQWFLAEGTTTSSRDTFILVGNPGDSATTLTVTYLVEGAPNVSLEYSVEAEARLTIDASSDVPNSDFSIMVDSAQPVVVERTLFGDADGITQKWGHTSIGRTETSDTWLLAEGATHSVFETFLLIANTNSQDVDATIRFLRKGLGPVSFQVTLPAMSRTTVNVESDYPADLTDVAEFSTEITTDGNEGILVERAIFFTSTGFTERSGATAAFGVNEPRQQWFLPEGAVGGPSGFENFILVGNPNGTDVDVDVKFVRDDGQVFTVPQTIPAGERISVKANDNLPASEGTQSVSTVVSVTGSLLGVIVERAMYFNDRIEGHASTGFPQDPGSN